MSKRKHQNRHRGERPAGQPHRPKQPRNHDQTSRPSSGQAVEYKRPKHETQQLHLPVTDREVQTAAPLRSSVPKSKRSVFKIVPGLALKRRTPKHNKRWSRRKRALVVLTVFLVLFGGIGYAFSRTFTGPSVGTVVQNLPASARTTEVELEQFDGTNFSFVHPMNYLEQVTKPNSNTIETRTFVSSAMSTRFLSIVITKFPTNRLEDDPSYLMRSQETAKYKMRSLVIKNEKVVVFAGTDPQQYQQAAFWLHQGKLMTFTMSGVASDPETMNKEYQLMLESISWR